MGYVLGHSSTILFLSRFNFFLYIFTIHETHSQFCVWARLSLRVVAAARVVLLLC